MSNLLKKKEKIKICLIVPAHWESLMGGSQYQAKFLLEHLLKLEKYEIYYLARRIPNNHLHKEYQVIQISENTGIRRYGYFVDAFRLFRLLKEIRPDVIYQIVGSAYTGIAAYYAKKYGCKMIWRVTSDKSVKKDRLELKSFFPHRCIEKMFTNYGITNSKYIVTQTEDQSRLLLENYNREATTVIRNYHPAPILSNINKNKIIQVLWVANFKRLKQPELFIQLAQDFLNYKNVLFIMIGAPAIEKKWFNKILNKIKGINNLEYRGHLSQENVNLLLAESHLLVNTSKYEGFSNTFIQAWLREVPVVSMNSNPDNLLGSGFLGYCAYGDYIRLLESVKALVDNLPLIYKIGKRARQYALRAHSENNISELITLFEEKA